MYSVVIFEDYSNDIMEVVNFDDRGEAQFLIEYLDEVEDIRAQLVEVSDSVEVLRHAKENAPEELKKLHNIK